jgi:two-component system response regulator RegA
MDTRSEVRLQASEGRPRELLVLDDNDGLRNWLFRAMERRGFMPHCAESIAEATALLRSKAPDYAVIDMRLEDGNGLEIIPLLRKARPKARIVVLTGYGNLASAVAAIKAGANDYLAKPAAADQIAASLLSGDDDRLPPPPDSPMSADRVRWEHIQRVFEQCSRNVSETARRLKMHRRTLQRILNKHAPRR